MILPLLELESLVQIEDKTRINASKSFVSPDEAAITLIEIQPSASDLFYDITALGYLDWMYSAAATNVVTVRITTDGAPVTKAYSIVSVTAATDLLFSTDDMLSEKEPDILSWIKDGRSSYKDKHRAAQQLILSYLNDIKGFRKSDGSRFDKSAIIDIEEVKEWSRNMVLRMIFQGLSNAVDDIFDKKSKYYEKYEQIYQNKHVLKLDIDGDGVAHDVGPCSIRMVVK